MVSERRQEAQSVGLFAAEGGGEKPGRGLFDCLGEGMRLSIAGWRAQQCDARARCGTAGNFGQLLQQEWTPGDAHRPRTPFSLRTSVMCDACGARRRVGSCMRFQRVGLTGDG